MKTLDEWTAAVIAELGLPGDVDVRKVLELARDVAHGVERPAAPLTTWLAGMAVANGGDADDVMTRIRGLAATWQQ
jgi:hypothetical protein